MPIIDLEDLNDETDLEAADTLDLKRTDEPCTACGAGGDETDVHLHDARTFSADGKPDPQIALCTECAGGHHAFFDEQAENEREDDDEEEERNAA
jgi:hypothetical protein